ncbi:hypothetical protein RCO48_27510 [Peribacillus frigoritolerans]|nr:hypothetical protein [Peribacillus frigoritolerans]
MWLALHFFGGFSFLSNLDVVFYTLAGSALIMAGSCSFNNYYDRDIDHLMERTKKPSNGNWESTAFKGIGVKFSA